MATAQKIETARAFSSGLEMTLAASDSDLVFKRSVNQRPN
jgi:hypothetical protein